MIPIYFKIHTASVLYHFKYFLFLCETFMFLQYPWLELVRFMLYLGIIGILTIQEKTTHFLGTFMEEFWFQTIHGEGRPTHD